MGEGESGDGHRDGAHVNTYCKRLSTRSVGILSLFFFPPSFPRLFFTYAGQPGPTAEGSRP